MSGAGPAGRGGAGSRIGGGGGGAGSRSGGGGGRRSGGGGRACVSAAAGGGAPSGNNNFLISEGGDAELKFITLYILQFTITALCMDKNISYQIT